MTVASFPFWVFPSFLLIVDFHFWIFPRSLLIVDFLFWTFPNSFPSNHQVPSSLHWLFLLVLQWPLQQALISYCSEPGSFRFIKVWRRVFLDYCAALSDSQCSWVSVGWFDRWDPCFFLWASETTRVVSCWALLFFARFEPTAFLRAALSFFIGARLFALWGRPPHLQAKLLAYTFNYIST